MQTPAHAATSRKIVESTERLRAMAGAAEGHAGLIPLIHRELIEFLWHPHAKYGVLC